MPPKCLEMHIEQSRTGQYVCVDGFGLTLCSRETSDIECAGGKVQHVTFFKYMGSIVL